MNKNTFISFVKQALFLPKCLRQKLLANADTLDDERRAAIADDVMQSAQMQTKLLQTGAAEMSQVTKQLTRELRGEAEAAQRAEELASLPDLGV